jgi:Glutamine amidotransferase domain
MCGLVGLFGNLNDHDKRIFDYLLILDIVRGRDATGIIKVHTDNSYEYIKDTGLPDSLIMLDKFMEDQPPFFDHNTSLVLGNVKALLGHNRHATVGSKTSKEAHPYEFPNVIGMHNGTIPWVEYRDMEYHKESVTDSEALYYDFNRRGVAATVKEVHGAMACTMWNSRDNTLQIFRNSERPLFTMNKKDGSAFVWASEPWMLIVAAQKTKESHTWEIKPTELPVDTLFTFEINDNVISCDTEKLEVKKVQGNFTRGGFKNGSWVNDPKYGGRGKKTEENFPFLNAVLPEKAKAKVSFDSRNITNLDFYYTYRKEHDDFIPSDGSMKFIENVDGFIARWSDAKEWHFYPSTQTNLPALVVDNTKKAVNKSYVTKAEIDELNKRRLCVTGTLPHSKWIRILFETEAPHHAYFFDNTTERSIAPKRMVLDSLSHYIVKEASTYWLTTGFVVNNKEKKEESMYFGPNDKLFTAEEIADFVAGTNGCLTCGVYPDEKDYDQLEWTTLRGPVTEENTFTCCPECREPIPDFCRMH